MDKSSGMVFGLVKWGGEFFREFFFDVEFGVGFGELVY